MSKTLISLIAITVILVLGVAFLMRGYFISQAIIGEQGEAIAEQGVTIAEQEAAVAKQGVTIAEQETAIAKQGATIAEQGTAIENLELCVQSLESESTKLKARVGALEAEWKKLEALGGYREFSSVQVLRQWLWDNPISGNQYIPGVYDCDDFAMDLTLAAIRSGRWIGLFASDSGGGHLKNFAVITNSVYVIEPQTDEVSFWGYVD